VRACGPTELRTWSFDEGDWAGERAAVVVPTRAGLGAPPVQPVAQGARFPLLVALHGRGEARKLPAEGAMGWPRDYALVRALARLCAPPLVPTDFEGFVDDERLRSLNEALAARPFAGLVVACPYLPDVDLLNPSQLDAYGRFVLQALMPRARREAPTFTTAASTGIDGVSLGGAVALHVGLANADAFGAVGAIQPALSVDDIPEWAVRGQRAVERNPALRLRLLTSHDDHFREAVLRLSDAWNAAKVAHELLETPGPHDYSFNRGPGSIELGFWHDRTLARS